jgi:hypothetical protein
MAKRHHSSHKHDESHKSHHSSHRSQHSRMHERSEHRHKMMHEEHYAGAEPRRRQEMEDAGMIHEDHNAVANLPQDVMMKYYPREGGYTPEDLDDTIKGIDHQMGYDNRKKMEHFMPKKV